MAFDIGKLFGKKDSADMMMPKKMPKALMIFLLVLTVFITVFLSWIGYVVDSTAGKKGADINKAMKHYQEYTNAVSVINSVGAALNGGNAQIGAMLGICAGTVVLFMVSSKYSKRYHRKGVEHGSARWGDDNEKKLIQDPFDFYNNVICSTDVFLVIDRKKRDEAEKKKSGNKKQASVKKRKHENEIPEDQPFTVDEAKKRMKKASKIKPMLNLNMIILGGSGTGKSRFFVKPNLLQCNTSFVVTDPSGELLRSCGKMLERNGYKIKVFNVDDMTHSSNYNPFHYLKNGDSDGYDENAVIKMINVFMMNTKQEGSSGGDQFWDDATRLLLSAVVFLILEKFPDNKKNFATVLQIIHTASIQDDEGGGKGKKYSTFDGLFEVRRQEYEKALSVQYYDEFKQAAGKTMQSILISTTTKLQHFKLQKLRDLTFKDNIHLEELGNEKQALFIIIPSTDTTYNFLAAMMYTQLFDTLYSIAMKNPSGHLDYHVQFLLDEFANVGKIPEFDKVLATCRKFWISAVVILQNLTQLKRLYEKSWEELPGNADTMIYLGGKDQFTNEYLMKSLGKETIDTQSMNQTKGKQGSTSLNNAILGRELMQINELETMDNSKCIVMVRGLPPFFTDKFDVVNHPRYSQLDEASKDGSNTFDLNIFPVDTEPEDDLDAVSSVSQEYYEEEIVEVNCYSYDKLIEDDEEKAAKTGIPADIFRQAKTLTVAA